MALRSTKPSMHRRTALKVGSALSARLLSPGHIAHAASGNGLPGNGLEASSTEMAQWIRQRWVTCEELVKAHVDRIGNINDALNAVVYHNPNAIEAARLADKQIDERSVNWDRQPLFGVPITIKDNIHVADMPSSAGVPVFKSLPAKEDATAVKRLRRAGAIILGKTNLPPLGMHFETDNSVFGRTNNPYNVAYTPGGSSGGEAAIIAACGSPLGIGSDLGGSIRVPAHFCGIAGIRPSFGRVSFAGHPHHAPKDNSGASFMVRGPLARYVADLEVALRVIAGPDGNDHFTALPDPLRRSKNVDLSRLKVAHFTDTAEMTVTSDTRGAIASAVKQLRGTVDSVTEDLPKDFDSAIYLHGTLNKEELLGLGKILKEQFQVDSPSLPTRELLRATAAFFDAPLPAHLERPRETLALVVSSLRQFMNQYDVVLCPVYRSPAIKHGFAFKNEANRRAWTFTLAWSTVPQHPVGVIRCGESGDGLPVGIQVVGPAWREDVVLAVMAHLEQQLGGWRASSALVNAN